MRLNMMRKLIFVLTILLISTACRDIGAVAGDKIYIEEEGLFRDHRIRNMP